MILNRSRNLAYIRIRIRVRSYGLGHLTVLGFRVIRVIRVIEFYGLRI